MAFVSNRAGAFDIWLMNADGSGLVNVTQSAADDSHPAWSPDGKTIAYFSDESGEYALHLRAQNGMGVLNWVSRAPSAAMRSRLGVRTCFGDAP